MNETLRTKLVATIAAEEINIRLSEDEVQGYPFVTYEMTVNPLRTKDGVYGFSGETYVRIVSDVFSQADTLRGTIEDAIEDGMNDEVYSSRLIAVDKDCSNDIWTIELNYLLRQNGEEAQEEEPSNNE